jgi:UDP-2,3-diacylglucosamine hydrolase
VIAGAVLGTPVHRLPAAVADALLISDLHVPADGGQALARLRAAVDFVCRSRLPLFVLGDLFDSYVCRAQAGVGVWREVAGLLAAVASTGAPVHLLHGNRDFLLGAEFAAASGAHIVAGGLRVPLGGVDTLLLHGDELCVNDRPYQRAKRWLRSAPVRHLCRALPLSLALWVAARARARSQRVVQRGDQQRFLPTGGAVDAALATGVRRLVFGHIHRHARGGRGGGEYLVLPAFDATGIGFLVRDGGIAAVCFGGPEGPPEPVPPPPPLPLGP